MKKIFACLALFALLGFSGFAEKNPKIVALECNIGPYSSLGISADLDFNFGSFFAINGLSLHVSFIWDTYTYLVLLESLEKYYKYTGIGAKLGFRYFFGQSGLDGFFLGFSGMTNRRDMQPKSSEYGSGHILSVLRILGGEIGYRFLIFDYITLTLGIYVGGLLDQSGGGEITWNYAKTGMIEEIYYDDSTYYAEFVIGVGFAL
jgi:hypothetical protein